MRNRPMLPIALGLVVLSMAWLSVTGVGIGPAAEVTATLAVQTMGGAYLWGMLRERAGAGPGPIEKLGVGFAVGSAMAMLSGVVLAPFAPAGWAWLVPSIVTSAVWVARRLRGLAGVPAAGPPASVLVGAAIAVAVGLAALTVSIRQYPLAWEGAYGGYHPDMLFFEALSNSVSLFGPSDGIFMAGAELRYHWFTFAWIGEISQSLGLDPFVGLTRVLPLAALLGSALIAAAWAGRRSRVAWVPALAAILVTAGGYVGAAYGTLLNFESPSQALTTVWLLALAFTVVEFLDDAVGRWSLCLIALLSVASTGGKSSASIVMVGALGLAWLVAAVRRAEWRGRALAALLAAGVPAAATYVLVLAGSATSGDLRVLTWAFRASTVQGLDLGSGAAGIAAGTGILVLAVVPRWAGVLGYWMDPSARWSASSIVGVGLAVMGLVPLLVLSQGVNEVWFALCASAPLAVLSAIGLGMAWDRLATRCHLSPVTVRRALVVSGFAGAAVFVVVSLVWARGGSGVVSVRAAAPILAWVLAALVALVVGRQLARPGQRMLAWTVVAATVLVGSSALARATTGFGQVGVTPASASSDTVSEVATLAPPSPPAESTTSPFAGQGLAIDFGNSWSALETQAAAFIDEQTPRDAVIVTDRTVSPLVPALTGRRTYLSGAPYQALYGRPESVDTIFTRTKISNLFLTEPSRERFDELCGAGVTHGWITGRVDPDTLLPYASVVFANDAVTVVQLDADLCVRDEQGSSP